MLLIAIVVIIVVCIFVILYAISNKVFNVAIKSKVDKNRVLTTNAEDSADVDRTAEAQACDWLRAQTFEEHTLVAPDGTKLFGRVLRAQLPTHNWVFLFHGYTGDGLKMGSTSRHFHNAGYHVFLPDLRGCGQSGGTYVGMGWPDSRDMLLWIDKLTGDDPDARIVLAGGSLGGATTMMTAGLNPPKVVAAMEDCGYTSVWDVFTHQLKKVFGLPQFPFMYIANVMAKRRAGYSFKEASSIARLQTSRVPMLFIHGTKDEFVPFSMLEQNYAATSAPKQKLVVPDAGHGVSANIAPELYWTTVDRFLEPYIK